ncbi:MAG: restriction endonuclease subunit S [Acidiferrobacterales bacterium]
MKKKMQDPPVTNDLYGKFDEMVSGVLGEKPGTNQTGSVITNKAAVASWSIPLQKLYDNDTVRLDASHYDQDTASAISDLASRGFELDPLSSLADVRLPGQFVRIWAAEEKYGYTYVNATDLMSLTGIGVLSGNARYLSHETDTDIEELIIREGWLLMTCSGTIGRVFYVAKRFDGWVATHDLIRIVPKAGVKVGFLHAYLTSPAAQKQIMGHTHGGQIDHVTHHQIGGVLVPRIDDDEKLKIHTRTMQALNLREKSIEELKDISDGILISMKSKSQKRKS